MDAMDSTEDLYGDVQRSLARSDPATMALADRVTSSRSPQAVETVPTKRESRRLSKATSIGQSGDSQGLKRRTSKLGLFGLFNRSKLTLDVETPQEKLGTQWEGIVSTDRPITRDPSAAYIPPDTDLTPIQETPDIPLQHQPSRGALRNKPSFKRDTSNGKPSTPWNPPPLFQVYPQSIKHATLKSPSMSTDTILRLGKEAAAKEAAQNTPAIYGERSNSVGDKSEMKEKKLKKTVTLGDWIEKIYVLVTAGYLLQYSGHGAHDRLPEKIMPLSGNSAAFASDVIPGRFFVIQVSHISHEDGTVDPEASRSVFKKMGLWSESKRSASNFLLVLETPAEMSDWLVAIRREIEAMGGKSYRPDVLREDGSKKPFDETQPTPQLPSQRYLVKRIPHQYSEKPWEPPADVSFNDNMTGDERGPEYIKDSIPASAKRGSVAARQSKDSRYTSDTHASIDQVHLDRLRQSYASTGDRTTSTSRESSPDRSFLMGIAEPFVDPIPSQTTAVSYRPAAKQKGAPDADRESLQPTPTPSSRPLSIVAASPERVISPAPNFSVPSFSKRYSIASASSPPSMTPPATATPPPPSASEAEGTNGRSRRTTMMGEPQPRAKSTTRTRWSSPQPLAPSGTSIASTHPNDPPLPAEIARLDRLSSPEHARGVTPPQQRHSPSPHPPPTAPLPPVPVPNSDGSSRPASLVPPPTAPPTGPLPAIPTPPPSQASVARPPGAPPTGSVPSTLDQPSSQPTVAPVIAPSPELTPKASDAFPQALVEPASSDAVSQEPISTTKKSRMSAPAPPKLDEPTSQTERRPVSLPGKSQGTSTSSKKAVAKPKGLRRPGSTQHQRTPSSSRSDAKPVPASNEAPATSASSAASPPRPTREAPAPPPVAAVAQSPPRPPTPPNVKPRRSMPRLGRKSRQTSPSGGNRRPQAPTAASVPVPVIAPTAIYPPSTGSQASPGNSSPSFLPPVDVSPHHASRGSLDGPWNAGYTDGIQRRHLESSA